MKYFNVLVLVAALIAVASFVPAAQSSEIKRSTSYGCGSTGYCYTWCNGGDGWCHTSQACSGIYDCNPNLDCSGSCYGN